MDERFYTRTNVVRIARDLVGKTLCTRLAGVVTGGIIVETEAYSWRERGCHAFGGKKTARNQVMFEEGGLAYVYLCYGTHSLFNIVTNKAGRAEAVLIRALEPRVGVKHMEARRGKLSTPYHLTSGPGKLTRALGIDRTFYGKSLRGNDVWVENGEAHVRPADVVSGRRIGIDYAGIDAKLPWRFTLRGSLWVSVK